MIWIFKWLIELYRNYIWWNFKYNLDEILVRLELSLSQFIDFCILCGCDYTTKIHRLGSETAYKLIKQHLNIENIIQNCCGQGKRFKYEEKFNYNMARQQFKNNYNNTINIINNNNIKKFIEEKDFYDILNNTKYSEETLRNKINLILQ